MTMNSDHLTKIDGVAALLAWHREQDVQAVRLADGAEALFVDGKRVALDPDKHYWPSQQVINYCRGGKREPAGHKRGDGNSKRASHGRLLS